MEIVNGDSLNKLYMLTVPSSMIVLVYIIMFETCFYKLSLTRKVYHAGVDDYAFFDSVVNAPPLFFNRQVKINIP